MGFVDDPLKSRASPCNTSLYNATIHSEGYVLWRFFSGPTEFSAAGLVAVTKKSGYVPFGFPFVCCHQNIVYVTDVEAQPPSGCCILGGTCRDSSKLRDNRFC